MITLPGRIRPTSICAARYRRRSETRWYRDYRRLQFPLQLCFSPWSCCWHGRVCDYERPVFRPQRAVLRSGLLPQGRGRSGTLDTTVSSYRSLSTASCFSRVAPCSRVLARRVDGDTRFSTLWPPSTYFTVCLYLSSSPAFLYVQIEFK